LPLLGIYHGNRLEEFAQLHRADVRCEEGIWFLDINDEGDKRVKNEQSKRRVPLHPELMRLRFLDYVEKAAPNPNDRVFPLLQTGGPDQKLGYYFTKWWSRYRRDVGVYEKGLDYHSFRASVTTKLAEAGVSLEVRNELLGHEGKSTDERNYQKGFSLKFLAEAIGSVAWPEVRLQGHVDTADGDNNVSGLVGSH
jgi:integrase